MRMRLPELLEERKMTAYELSKRSEGRITLSTIYRLVRQQGRVRYIDAEVAQAICDVLEIPPARLFDHQNGRADSRARRKRTRK